MVDIEMKLKEMLETLEGEIIPLEKTTLFLEGVGSSDIVLTNTEVKKINFLYILEKEMDKQNVSVVVVKHPTIDFIRESLSGQIYNNIHIDPELEFMYWKHSLVTTKGRLLEVTSQY